MNSQDTATGKTILEKVMEYLDAQEQDKERIKDMYFKDTPDFEYMISTYREVIQEQQQNEVFVLKDLDYSVFADTMISRYKIAYIDDALYRYNNGVYIALDDRQIDWIIMDNLYNSKINHRKEITRYIEKNAPKKSESSNRYILFNNCVYDIKTKKTLPVSEGYVFLNRIPFNYNRDVKESKKLNQFLSDLSCNDKEIQQLIIQLVGYCLYRCNKLGKFFIIKGRGGNGKSTLFDLINYTLGGDNISELSLDGLSEKYGVGEIRNKLVNMGDDIEDKYIESVSLIKKAVTGETIKVEEKYQRAQYFKYKGKLIFSANNIPTMSDKSDGLKRRLVVIPFMANFVQDGNADINIIEKLKTRDNAEYLLKIAVDQLHQLLDNKGFVKSARAEEATMQYSIENNPVLEFIHEQGTELNELPVSTAYARYKLLHEDDGSKLISSITFSKRIKNEGYEVVPKWINNKTVKVFIDVKKYKQ